MSNTISINGVNYVHADSVPAAKPNGNRAVIETAHRRGTSPSEAPCYAFHDYREEKPPAAGWYVWRLPHKFIEGVTLIFLAKYRKRGAGFESVLSPEFDHWNGYRVLLPKGSIEWAEYTGEPPKPGCELLEVVGVENVDCPFCKNKPKWRYSGRYICAGPTNTDSYRLECCQWANTVRMENPIALAEKRNALLRA